jgi:hypothetical protein
MIAAALIALMFFALAVIPCCIGLYIRSSLHPVDPRPISKN